ncbi:MAG: Uncharacterised protein [Flavobacterium sp. SCGC AAA160-P02]|nr:MAG: Uncharacterised protein [Flavobacterium sp. SCGC AAA160-P02]
MIFEVGESVTFTVTDDEDEDITSQSTILVDGTAITGSTFSPSNPGNYEIKATYKSVTSNKIFITVDPPVTLSSIDITSSEPAIFIGSSVTFSARAIYSDNSSIDITSDSEFYVDDIPISGNEYTGNEEGAINVKAEYESITSSLLQVQVVDSSNLPASFSKKGVIEDFTGTWCGWCPRVSHAASLVEAQTDRVFIVGIHNGDQMANSFGSQMEAEYNITGFPTAYIDRSSTWNYPEPNNISQAIAAGEGNANVGLAIQSTLTGSILQMTISTGFLENISDARLVVFILEDGIISDQENYTSYYGGGSVISNFEHNGVLRYAATNILGDATTSILGIHEQSFNTDLNSYGVQQPSNTGILAMLVDQSGRVLLNAQYASVNQTQNFD